MSGINFDEVSEIQVSTKDGKTIIYKGNGLNVFRREMMSSFGQATQTQSQSQVAQDQPTDHLVKPSGNSRYQQRSIVYNVSNKSMEQQIAEMEQSCAAKGIRY